MSARSRSSSAAWRSLAGLIFRHFQRPPRGAAGRADRLRSNVCRESLCRRTRIRPGAGDRAGDERPAHPPGRPRAELQHERRSGRGLVAGGSVLGVCRRDRGPLRPAPRRRQRGRDAPAARGRERRPRGVGHRAREDRRAQAHGLRAPDLQELRPAGQDHQGDRRGRLQGHRAPTRCWTSRSRSNRPRCRTSTSSAGSSIRTWTSIPG